MKKFLLCLTSLTFITYGAEDIIKKDIQELKNERSTTFSDKFHFKKQNNAIINRKNAVMTKYYEIEAKHAKKSIDEKTLLLHRYKCIDDLLDNLLYAQALLDIIDMKGDENLHAVTQNLFQRKIKFADDYNIYNKAKGLDKQKVLLGLQHAANLFNDIKEHSDKIEAAIHNHLEKK